MQIAINSMDFKNYIDGANDLFWGEMFQHLVKDHPEHHFHFLIDQANHPFSHIKGGNVSVIILNKTIKTIAGLKFWSIVQLPLLLKKIKANVVVQLQGYCSPTAQLPQLLVIDNLLWMHHPSFLPADKRLFYRVFTKGFIKKAAGVIVLSDSVRQGLVAKFPKNAHKIEAIKIAAPSIYKPVSDGQRMQVKDGYAEGRDYFLFPGGNEKSKNVEGLVKAFSLFKKWQRSNMKLLIAGAMTPQKQGIIEKLGSYKYKDDVVLLQGIDRQQLAMVTAAAYAFIFPSVDESSAIQVLSAMQCGVPVIASDQASLKEVGGESCLFAPPNDVDGFANHMKMLYKNELFRGGQIEKALQQATGFSMETTANLFWKNLLKAIA